MTDTASARRSGPEGDNTGEMPLRQGWPRPTAGCSGVCLGASPAQASTGPGGPARKGCRERARRDPAARAWPHGLDHGRGSPVAGCACSPRRPQTAPGSPPRPLNLGLRGHTSAPRSSPYSRMTRFFRETKASSAAPGSAGEAQSPQCRCVNPEL